ncbi:hypothetical protein BO99DRAFT_436775 [Aspergillus violaceofuscus CBS 115571]|uniref:Uncharacterized protein n=1 Tax=Aspergillus violaceofuscus (strain CBS 115571) TaxID=1450538 RepID=A0A2V5I5Z3_ASPV1|nr:hypothetical protein BO99DRAFT_436775 [Aspergillus violaceofuscus CBS 115571]
MDTSWTTTNHSVKMITPPYNAKRSSSPNAKVRTSTQRREAEDLDDGKQRNLENKNASSPPRRHYDKKRKTERNSTDALEAALNLPSFACAASLLDPMKFSHARAAGATGRQQMDVDRVMAYGVDEPSGHFPSTLSDSSPSNGIAGLAAGEVADAAGCAVPPPAPHPSSHTYRTYIPVLSSEYPLNYLLSTDREPCAAAENQAHHHNHYHHSFSRTGFPIYEDPDDIEIQFQEIRVNVFAPWDEDKENIDEGSWNGEPVEEEEGGGGGGGGGEQHHEDSSNAVTIYSNRSTRNGNTHIFESHDLTLNTNLETDTDMNMGMDLDLDLDSITMFPSPENSLSSTPTTQHSMDTNAFNWDVNAHLTTILTTTTGDTNPPSAALFDEPEATVGPWTHVPDLVAPFSVVTSQELLMDDGTNHATLAPVEDITINPPPEFDFAEHDQVTPDASGLWLPWSSQSLTASEMAALALSVARQREEQMQGHQMLPQIPVQTDLAAAGGKRVRRGTRRL